MFNRTQPKWTLGKKIRALRKSKDWNQDQLAENCKISVSYISKIEKDQVPAPSIEVIQNMAKALNADYDELWQLAGKLDKDGLTRQADVRFGASLYATTALNMIAEKGLSDRQAEIVYKIAKDDLSDEEYEDIIRALIARDQEKYK